MFKLFPFLFHDDVNGLTSKLPQENHKTYDLRHVM